MERIKNINIKAFLVRLITSLSGTIISSFGIGCFYGCGLGTDPISVFVDGLHNVTKMSYGDISTICNVIQAILIFIFIRKYLGLGTLIGTILGGPLIDVFEVFVRTNYPVENTTITIKIIIMLIGLLTTGIGYALGIASKLGVGCFQFIPLFLLEKCHIDLKYSQMISDTVFFLIGFALKGVVGIGTVACVLLTGYIMDGVLNIIEKPIDDLGPLFY